ncbi:unnamed protein product [Vitrella brassicaformis CCMP3155]|uniref:Peptidase M41 domain-containing protein n=2 Tax=Vitrella brassicaformis TaxID=1169539 RepID=A0A0G4EGJ1_VITBC|nr:unnamed protein product [Vitrella brassicaformis CCMP3155]|eukprot:CEL94590.1 unnamed protein product [Vitrella brassicaformis CCMP3155]
MLKISPAIRHAELAGLRRVLNALDLLHQPSRRRIVRLSSRRSSNALPVVDGSHQEETAEALMERARRLRSEASVMEDEMLRLLTDDKEEVADEAAEEQRSAVAVAVAAEPGELAKERGEIWEALTEALAEERTKGEKVAKLLEALKLRDGVSLWDAESVLYRPTPLEQLKIYLKMRDVSNPARVLDIDGGSAVDKIALGLGVLCLVATGAVFLGALNWIPNDFVRYCVSLALISLPFTYMAVGIARPNDLFFFIAEVWRALSPKTAERLYYHEAAHFLVGYLLGLPIKSYSANSFLNRVEFYDDMDILTAADRPPESLRDRIQAGFEVPEGDRPREADDDDEVTLRRELRSGERRPRPGTVVNLERAKRAIVVASAGVAGEYLYCESAEGGSADIKWIDAVLRRTDPPLKRDERQDYMRWGVVEAYLLLDKYKTTLDALVDSFRAGRSIVECVKAIEDSA